MSPLLNSRSLDSNPGLLEMFEYGERLVKREQKEEAGTRGGRGTLGALKATQKLREASVVNKT